MTDTATITTDAVVIGAGPVGLYQAFQLGLLGLRTQLVDALPHPGGQCIELYPDKPIYDIPAVPRCTGRELVERLLAQLQPLAPGWLLGQTVESLAAGEADEAGGYVLVTSTGQRLHSRLVYIAAGAGCFTARRLAVDGAEALEGRGVVHHPTPLPTLAGRDVLVLGHAETAVDTALALAARTDDRPARVRLLHRRDQFDALPDTLAALQAQRAAGAIGFVQGQVTGLQTGTDGALAALDLLGPDGDTHRVPTDLAVVRLGLTPRLGPIADWGAALERKQLQVDTAGYETSLPGVYAVGDINTYPGKRRLIVSGFHEATLAAYAGLQRVREGRPVPLLYTTSSAELQRRLGVAPAAPR